MNIPADQSQNLSQKTLLSYGALSVPLTMVDVPVLMYLPVLYSRDIGISIGLVGLIFVLARIWDGVTDPLIGWLSDKTSSKYGRRKPWIVLSVPLLMISTWFAFNPPDDVGPVYVTFWLFCFFVSWTAVFIPYLSWGAELSGDYNDRSKVVGYREVCTMLGHMAVAAGPVVLLANDAPVQQVLFYLIAVTFVLFPITLASLASFVPDRIHTGASKVSVLEALQLLGANRPFRLFIIVIVLANLALGMLNPLVIFMVDEVFGLSEQFFKLYLVEYLSAIAFSPLVVYAAGRIGKHWTLSVGLAMFCLALIVFAFAPRENILFAVIGVSVLGGGFSALFIMPTSMLADIVDYDTVTSGEKRAGLYIAVFKFATKFTMALSVGIAYGILELIGYDAQGGNGEFGAFAIKLVALWIPALILLPAIVLISRFPINKHEQELIRQKIERSPEAP